MQQKKYNLVIGGSGFVGSFLIKNLDLDYTLNFDKNPSPFFNDITTIGNILDKENLYKILKDVETVILLAAEHRDDVSPTSLYYDVNVEGTKNVLEAMDHNNVKKLIFTSSVAVYGLNKKNPDESCQIDPFNHYGKSKWQAEKVIQKWYKNDPDNKSVSIIRPTVIFGERNRGNVYNLLKQISSGTFLMIGSGLNRKSMAYVGNVIAFISHLIKFPLKNYQVYNYVDKPDFNMCELVNHVQNKVGIEKKGIKLPYFLGLIGGYFFDFLSVLSSKKMLISSVRVKKFCATTQFDSKKKDDFFEAPFTVIEGLEKTLEHEFINPKKDDILFYSE